MSSSIRFLDPYGFAWQAVEVGPADLTTESGNLYFFSGGSTRRLARYPRDWSACGWEELEVLRRRATVLSADAVRHEAGPATA
ncbi:MAG: hypothetical protein JNJ98_21245 [Gemmatimonadetes bacterium]|nr:hypothetical protein [Gemmatimonadota bacterium]